MQSYLNQKDRELKSQLKVSSQLKSCYASIKSIQATLNILAYKTQNDESKQTFLTAEQMIKEIKKDLEKKIISFPEKT